MTLKAHFGKHKKNKSRYRMREKDRNEKEI